jgi:NAD(P)-dependent dehydrogenase (short-subunit alcohol dehydrogenase family)
MKGKIGDNQMAIEDVTPRSLSELISLAGKTAVVTGGARGIGQAISRRLAEAGAHVFVADLDANAADLTAQQIQENGHSADGAHLDAADSASHDALAGRVLRQTGRLDIWVNCAGIYPSQPVLEITDEDWHKVINLNLTGSFFGARAAGRHMAASGGGVIINLSSTSGLRPAGPGYAHYTSSKFGIVGLTQQLALELGPKNVRVLALAPTFVVTPGTDAQAASLKAATGKTGREIGERLPLGRAGLPDDIARVALFCASDLSLFMTGATLPVDGGGLVGR